MTTAPPPIEFETHRAHLRDVAYRMLGSLAAADDAVQEAWLRFDRAAPADVANPRGWLTTVVARVCLDQLRARAARREESLSPDAERGARPPGEAELVMAEQVGLALLVVLDRLEPAARIAFVLHDALDLPFDEIAEIVGRTPEATRQLASRARRLVRGGAAVDAGLAGQAEVVAAFVAALARGDVAGLVAVLDPDVVGRATGPDGAVREVRGARTWAEGAMGFAAFARHMVPALVGGAVGLVLAPGGRLARALRFTFAGGRIASAEILVAPAQLAALEIAALASAAPEVLHTTAGDLPLEEAALEVGDRVWHIRHSGAVIGSAEEQAFLASEAVLTRPYGVVLWPAAIALAHEIASRDVCGARVLELGAGTGLPGIVAAAAGARVVQTDRQALVLHVCELNAARNGVTAIEHRRADWTAWTDEERYDLILGSDILYAPGLHDHLAHIFTTNLAPGGAVLIADPFRAASLPFLERLAAAGWHVTLDKWTVGVTPPPRPIGVYTLTRPR